MVFASNIISGKVYQTDGTTIYAGVLVRAINRSNQGQTEVYSDSLGNYTLEMADLINSGGTIVGWAAGDSINITGRTAGYRVSATITLSSSTSTQTQNLTMSVSVTYTTADKVANFIMVPNFPDVSSAGSNPVKYMRVEDIINRMERL